MGVAYVKFSRQDSITAVNSTTKTIIKVLQQKTRELNRGMLILLQVILL